jgi:hypothetical protein
MILKIALNGRELDGIPLEPRRMKEPGYIDQQVNELKLRHAVALEKALHMY